MKNKLMDELKRLFRPEFLNRVDEVVVFHALTREDIEQIVDIQLRQAQRAPGGASDHAASCTDAGRELLVKKGYDPQFGARPLRRAIQRLVEDPLSEKLLANSFKDGDTVLVDAQDGEIVLRASGDAGVSPTHLAFWRAAVGMPKSRTRFVCQACGATQPTWMGRCPECGEWNTLVETVVEEPPRSTLRVGAGRSCGASALSAHRDRRSGAASACPCRWRSSAACWAAASCRARWC